MSTWTELHDAKRGVAEMLTRAADALKEPGADPVRVTDALADVAAARLCLLGVANAAEVLRASEMRKTDGVMLRAGKEAS